MFGGDATASVGADDRIEVFVSGEGSGNLIPFALDAAKTKIMATKLSSYPSEQRNGGVIYRIPVSAFGTLTEISAVQLQDRSGGIAPAFHVFSISLPSGTGGSDSGAGAAAPSTPTDETTSVDDTPSASEPVTTTESASAAAAATGPQLSLTSLDGWSDSWSFGGVRSTSGSDRVFTPKSAQSGHYVGSNSSLSVTGYTSISLVLSGDSARSLTFRLVDGAKKVYTGKSLPSYPQSTANGWVTFSVRLSDFPSVKDITGVQLIDKTGGIIAAYKVRAITLVGDAPSAVPAGQQLYSATNTQVISARNSLIAQNRSADAALLDPMVSTPTAVWITSSATSPQQTVANIVASAASEGRIPQFVLYNVPKRDCNSYSAGGASSAAAYRTWVDQVKSGLGTVKAIVIVEPDALAQLSCLTSASQTERLSLISYAVSAIKSQGSAVYVDAGNSGWVSASVIAGRLRSVGVGADIGFSLNVSNYNPTAAEVTYGNQVSGLVGGGARFVVDTSRNGSSVSATTWCNPRDQRLGERPSLTKKGLLDGVLWIKRPGESDGECNGGPAAGVFWVDGALELGRVG